MDVPRTSDAHWEHLKNDVCSFRRDESLFPKKIFDVSYNEQVKRHYKIQKHRSKLMFSGR